MRTFGKTILAFSIATMLAAPAWAQQGRGFGRGGGAALLTNKSVQQELKVTDAQAEKLTAFGEQIRTKQREEFQKLQDVSEDQRPAKMQELMRSINADLQKGLPEILKPEQVKRFTQIQLQQAGPNAFMTPNVQQKLKLTDDQKTKIREITDVLGQSMREAGQNFQADREGTMKKMAELRKDATDKVFGVLTDDQKKSHKELVGDPFEVKYEPRPNN
jgi:Spy/CpxP family protein refolding chaperone